MGFNSGFKGLSIVVEACPRSFSRILLLQGCLLQTRYATTIIAQYNNIFFGEGTDYEALSTQ